MTGRGAGILAAAALAAGCSGGTLDRPSVAPVGGDASRGAAIIASEGCGGCHIVPGVRGAHGMVGPPLTSFGRRGYIAGRVANSPGNLVRWIYDPRLIDPETVMPRLGLSEQQARDVAAYLYTLR